MQEYAALEASLLQSVDRAMQSSGGQRDACGGRDTAAVAFDLYTDQAVSLLEQKARSIQRMLRLVAAHRSAQDDPCAGADDA